MTSPAPDSKLCALSHDRDRQTNRDRDKETEAERYRDKDREAGDRDRELCQIGKISYKSRGFRYGNSIFIFMNSKLNCI